jgi:hydroxymethylpyrimidine pyrophosphatase-like HAD family hydrolase
MLNRPAAVEAVKELRQQVIMSVGTGGREVSDMDDILRRLTHDKRFSPEKAVQEAVQVRDCVTATH